MNEVYILWHVHEFEDSGLPDDEKLIGVYRTSEDAEAAKQRVAGKAGFKEWPSGFQIHRYILGQDGWTEGYVTLQPEDM